MGKILGNASKPYAKRTWRGKPFDNRTVSALKWVEQKYIEVAPKKRAPLVFYQGSYSTGASPNSKGTHDGGGAVDVNVSGMTHKQKMALVKWFRKGGWSAWLRPRMSDTWPEHIHAILRGHRTASAGAQAQVVSYERHRDGLAGDNWDSTWRPRKKRRWSHRKNRPIEGK